MNYRCKIMMIYDYDLFLFLDFTDGSFDFKKLIKENTDIPLHFRSSSIFSAARRSL